jgi:hypothetical protein
LFIYNILANSTGKFCCLGRQNSSLTVLPKGSFLQSSSPPSPS